MNRVLILTVFAMFLISCSEKIVLLSNTPDFWSKKSPSGVGMNWSDAKQYCANLNEDGYSNWRLPTISELRTLIKNCPATENGGKCKVTDGCLSYDNCKNDACDGCSYSSAVRYSKLGDTSFFWSSSESSDNAGYAWGVHFNSGQVFYYGSGAGFVDVRCVR